MNKMQLEILIKLPTRHFNSVIRLLNPKVIFDDLNPMFPDGWSHDRHWPDTDNYNYDSFAHHQIAIDRMNEEMMGC